MKKVNLKFLFLFAAIFGLLVFLHGSGFLSPVEGVVQSVLNPIAAKFQSLSGGFNLAYRRQTDKVDLAAKVEALESSLEAMTVENASLKKMEEENAKLRQYLDFFDDRNGLRRVMANVIARGGFDQSEGQGDFFIDRGSIDGIFEGLAAIDEKGALIGKVIAVEERSSRIALTTGANCRLAAAVLSGGRTIGMTSGNLGLTINLDFVPQNAEVKEGEVVVTSGLEPNIPSGLAIGRVISVDKGTNEIWQKVGAEPAVDFDKVFIVAVILP